MRIILIICSIVYVRNFEFSIVENKKSDLNIKLTPGVEVCVMEK